MNEKTVAQIGLELHESEGRVRYMIGKHNIMPCRTVGITRLYDEAAQELIREAIKYIKVQRG